MKLCLACKVEKQLNHFHKDKRRPSGLFPYCKPCNLERVAAYKLKYPERIKASRKKSNTLHHDRKLIRDFKYREANRKKLADRERAWRKANPKKHHANNAYYAARKLERTPAWADLSLIKQFYDNCPAGYQVDHIVPLNGKNVSGLHVLKNLQYLKPSDNLTKANKFDPYRDFNRK